MAKAGQAEQLETSPWGISRSTIISGIIAIVVIVGLFILFNALPASQEEEQSGEQTEEQQQEEEKQAEEKEMEKKDKDEEGSKLPTEYTIKKGDSLWKISKKFYGSGFRWTGIARENKLPNPDVILVGNKLTIPKASAVKLTHTVVRGDTLWDISKTFYGSGFQWKTIRDANPGKIGILPNGNPLITPGQVLAVP